MARRSRKASLLAYDLRERGMKPELVILQALAAKPKASGATSHVVIKAERGSMERLLEAGQSLTNSAHERTTPMLVQEHDARILRETSE